MNDRELAKHKKTLLRLSRLLLALLIAVLIMMPLLWIFTTSLRPERESFRLPPSFIPSPPLQWENYAEVFSVVPFFRFFINSLLVTSGSAIFQLIFSAMAAFALARIPFKGSNFVFVLILAGMMVPAQVTIIPLFIMMSRVGLYNSLFALILPGTVFPLAVFLMRQFIRSIPISLDEAAYIDGGNRSTVFFYIILPLVKSSLVVAGTIHLLIIWNDFFRPLIFINKEELMTLPLGLSRLQGYMNNGNQSVIMAGIILSIIIPTLIYILGQRFILEGTASSGIKG